MILFLEDWKKHPGASLHVETSNKTFVRYASVLRTMGVKNHAFPLALLNPELRKVDPHDPDISETNMQLVAQECLDNPWYFFREVARVPGRGSAEPVQFMANRGNISAFWLYFNHVTNILIQIRQTGKSLSIDLLHIYLQNIACTGNMIGLLTKDDTLRSANAERLKDLQSELPFYLNQRSYTDVANTEEITVDNLKNVSRLMVPNKSPKAALNIGRGLTVGTFITDEAAFIYNIAITLPAALAAGTAARDLARKKGSHFGTVLMTTAGKKDDRDGRYVYNLLCQSAVWTEKFFDCTNTQELESVIRSNSPKGKLRVNSTFNHRQLGYTDEWLKQAIEEAEAVGEDADRDFFNRWTSGSMASPLSVALLEVIEQSKNIDFVTTMNPGYNYVTRWHESASMEAYLSVNDVIMSIDSSDAAGGDDIFMTMRSVKTGAVVGAGNYNETNLIMFCQWLMEWFVKYPRITLIIERRSTGAMIIDYLLMMMVAKEIDPFKRIYNKVVQEADEYPDRFAEINKPMYLRDGNVYVKHKKAFGFATSAVGATSRNDLYSTTLINSAKYTGDKVRDPVLCGQILGLTVRNGRVDHQEGGNDDGCISWLLSGWLLFSGKNLQFYGINARDVLSDNSSRKKEVGTAEDQYEAREQKTLRDTVEQLTDTLKKERDPYISMRIEQRLRAAVTGLKVSEEEKLTINELIRQLKEQKQQTARTQSYSGFGGRSYFSGMNYR